MQLKNIEIPAHERAGVLKRHEYAESEIIQDKLQEAEERAGEIEREAVDKARSIVEQTVQRANVEVGRRAATALKQIEAMALQAETKLLAAIAKAAAEQFHGIVMNLDLQELATYVAVRARLHYDGSAGVKLRVSAADYPGDMPERPDLVPITHLVVDPDVPAGSMYIEAGPAVLCVDRADLADFISQRVLQALS